MNIIEENGVLRFVKEPEPTTEPVKDTEPPLTVAELCRYLGRCANYVRQPLVGRIATILTGAILTNGERESRQIQAILDEPRETYS